MFLLLVVIGLCVADPPIPTWEENVMYSFEGYNLTDTGSTQAFGSFIFSFGKLKKWKSSLQPFYQNDYLKVDKKFDLVDPTNTWGVRVDTTKNVVVCDQGFKGKAVVETPCENGTYEGVTYFAEAGSLAHGRIHFVHKWTGCNLDYYLSFFPKHVGDNYVVLTDLYHPNDVLRICASPDCASYLIDMKSKEILSDDYVEEEYALPEFCG